jgi:hypothetical protein
MLCNAALNRIHADGFQRKGAGLTRPSRNQNDGVRLDARQRMNSANGMF